MLFLYYKTKKNLAFLGVFGRISGTMNDEQFSQMVAWLNALKDENHRLNGQIKHLTDVVEAIGLNTANLKKDAEITRFRVGAVCLFFIVLPILLPVTLLLTGSVGSQLSSPPPAVRSHK